MNRFQPLASTKLLREIEEKSTGQHSLAARITPADIDWLVTRLIEVSEHRDDAEGINPAITRAAQDDYLIANAVAFQADYLVSGDHDLMALGDEVAGVPIVSLAAFAALLDEAS